MRKLALLVAAALAAVSVSGALAAGGGGSVKVQLKEFKIVPKPASVTSGKVTFTVKNVGKLVHEMVVVKTNVAPGKIPVKDNEASEKGAVGEVAELKAGKTGKVTLTLKPGKYVLLCNVPGHYKAGQYVRFTVK